MKNFNLIEEEVYELNQCSETDLNMIKSAFGMTDMKDYQYAYIISIPPKDKNLVFGFLQSSSKNKKPVIGNIRETLLAYNKYGFYDLLYFTTLYLPSIQIPNTFKKNPFDIEPVKNEDSLDKYLSISFGKIIYTFQIEQLYMESTHCDILEAIRIRRNINKKVNTTLKKLTEIKFDEEKSFMQLLNERMISDFVYYPNIRFARNLNDLINP
jgi:DNA polymerase III alpha subunit